MTRRAGPAPRSPAPRRRAHRGAKAARQLVTVALFFLMLELALGAFGVEPLDSDPYAGFSGFVPLFERAPGPGGDAWVTAPGKRPWFNEQRFAAPQPAHTLRLFSLGGSTTYGRPYDDRTSFSAWLRELLPRVDQGRSHEVINAGGISYASYRVLEVLREVLEHEPDALIVYTGHNEFLEERTYRDVTAAPAWLRQLGGLLSGTRLYALAHRALVDDTAGEHAPRAARDAGPDGSDPDGPDTDDPAPAVTREVTTRLDDVVGPDAYVRDDALRARILEHFRHNLNAMAELARRHDVPLILVAPASSLADCTPFQADAAAGPERDADALYAAGMAALADGRRDEARRLLTAARDQDVCALRAPTEFVQAVRDVAAARNLPLVDVPALLAARGADVPGRDWFLDHVHPTVEGHGLIAEGLLAALGRAGLVTLPAEGGASAVPEARAAIEAQIDPTFQGLALKNLAKVLGWAGKHAEAADLARQSQALLGSGDAETHFLLGNAARDARRLDEAAAHYRDAVALDDGYAEAWLNLGHALAGAGRPDEAEHAAQRAVALLPRLAAAH